MTKKIFAMFLAVLMVVSMLPTSVFAANSDECRYEGTGKHTKSNCDYTELRVVAPGCGTAGYTVNKCNACGDEFRTDEVEPTKEHVLVDLEAKAPTCGERGYEGGKMCIVCGTPFPATWINPVVKEGYSCEWTDYAPEHVDCTTGGIKTRECKLCGAIEEIEITLEETGGEHSWNTEEPKVVTPATPEANGLAIVECDECKITKEVVMFYEHAHMWMENDGKDPDCNAVGYHPYRECRICGRLEMKMNNYGEYSASGNYGEIELAQAVRPAAHQFECPEYCTDTTHTESHPATCVDTLLKCKECEEYVEVNVAHKVDWKETAWQLALGAGDFHHCEVKDATCISSGYIADFCNVCREYRDVKVLPVKGHHSVTVTVPAYCNMYAYTYTYCTREDCVVDFDMTGITTDYSYVTTTATPFAPLSALPAFDAAEQTTIGGFYLALGQTKLETDLFFTGEMEGDFLATSHDVRDAVKVYLDRVHSDSLNEDYYLYFYNDEGVKVYIYVEGYINSKNYTDGDVKLSTTKPATTWNWNDTYDILTTVVPCSKTENETFFLGTSGEYDTISAATSYYLDNVNYPRDYAQLSDPKATAVAVNVISCKVDQKAGYNKNNHNWEIITNNPTCTEPGSKDYWCLDCEANYSVEIPAKHDWRAMDASETVVHNGQYAPAYKAPDCEDGYQYYACNNTNCDAKSYKVLAGYGHVLGALIKPTPNHIDTIVYDHYECAYCDYVKNVNRKTWTNANKHWDSIADAQREHGNHIDELNKTVAKAGNCEEYGLYKYTCTGADGCNKPVYVKIPGTGMHKAPDLTADKGIYVNTAFKVDVTGYYTLTFASTVNMDKLILAQVGVGEIMKAGEIKEDTFFYLVADVDYNFGCDPADVGVEATLKQIEYVKDATCEEIGWLVTFVCQNADCGKTIGKKQGGIEFFDKLDHNWKENKNYVASECEKPVFEGNDRKNYSRYCDDCGHKDYDIELIDKSELETGECEGLVFQYYNCVCGEEHIRGYYTFKHNFVRLPDISAKDIEDGLVPAGTTITYQAPTCYATGWFTVKCEFCSEIVKNEDNEDLGINTIIPKVQHTNKAGERFDNTCLTASVEDRHCVDCHEYYNHDAKGNAHKCDLVLKDAKGKPVKDIYGNLIYICEGECWFSGNHHLSTTLHPSTCIEDGYAMVACEYCDVEVVQFVNGGWNGHKPAAAQKDDNDNWIKYGNYEYKDFTYYHVVIENGELVTKSETYYAEFALGENGEPGYIPATHSSEGFARSLCQICDEVHEWILPRLDNLEFEIATNSKEYSFGSMIELTLTVDGYEELIHGFNFTLDYGFDAHVKEGCTVDGCADATHYAHVSNLLFVGAETLNTDFMFNVSTPKAAKAGNKIQIVGQVSNDANGKVRNLVINEKTELVKLYFRVLTDMNTEVAFNLVNNGVRVYDAKGLTPAEKYPAATCQLINETAELRMQSDFNGDGYVADIDLYQAMMLITGELENGKNYDVTVDFDKDGVITVEDLLIGYDLFVGNIQSTFFVGIDEAEYALIVDLLELNKHEYNCVNNCGYGSDLPFILCPVCYTPQNQGI